MKRQLTITLAEALAVFVAIGLLTGACLFLQRSLSVSRSNEREMSARYSELVRTNTPALKHK